MEKKIPINEYDVAKRMLNTLRNFNKNNRLIREQIDQDNNINNTVDDQSQGSSDNQDFTVINNVDVVIHSTDNMDFEIKDQEKGSISQIIDSFRTEVSELADFGKLHIYDDSAKLEGQIGEMNLGFVLSAGDDGGVFLSNSSLLKLTDEVIDVITKLRTFEPKFTTAMNQIILNRKQN